MAQTPPFDFINKGGYEHGFFECHRDVHTLCAAWCAPCLLVGKTSGDLAGGSFNIWSCLCFGIAAYRNRRTLQTKYNMGETEDGSMCAVALCGCCAVAQDAHEAAKRGHGQPLAQMAAQPDAPQPAKL